LLNGVINRFIFSLNVNSRSVAKECDNAESCYESAEDDLFSQTVSNIHSPTTTSDNSISESVPDGRGVQPSKLRKWFYRFVRVFIGFVVCLMLLLLVDVAVNYGLISSVGQHFTAENFTNVSFSSTSKSNISISSAVTRNISNISFEVADTDAAKMEL